MKRILVFLFLAASVVAADSPVRVALDLNDGSRLLGEMPPQTVAVASPTLGNLNVALDRVSVMRMEHDGTATFFLRNGDKLQGKPAWTEVKLATKLGGLSAPLAQVRRLETFDADGVPSSLGEGLLLHLRFDRKNAAVKIHGAKPAAGRRGAAKSALEFDGKKSWVEVSNENGFRCGREATVCAWVKPMGSGEQQGLILGSFSNRKPGFGLGVSPGEGVTWTPVLEGNEGPYEIQHPADLTEWTLLIGAYDGVTAALYVNGRQAQTQRMPGVLAARAKMIVIGGAPNLVAPDAEPNPAEVAPPPPNGAAPAENAPAPAAADGTDVAGWFKGLIDEVRIYNRALNADEVRALFDATK
jgi:hypothetical protein